MSIEDQFKLFCNDCKKHGVEFTDPHTAEMFCRDCWTKKQ